MGTEKGNDQLARKGKMSKPPKHHNHWFSQKLWPALRQHPLRDVLALVVLLLFTASIICCIVAPGIGTAVGVAIGSWDGVTKGFSEGTEAGKEAGLSAEDTTVTISTKMKQAGKLEVLLVDLKLSDIYQHGTVPLVGGPKYATLCTMQGQGVFSVDLTQSKVTSRSESNKICIEIPCPEFESYLDDRALETVAEYKAGIFDGSTGDGYTGWLNSKEAIDKRVKEELLGYDSLMENAKASALKQVKRLGQSVCIEATTVEVQFLGEGEN